MLSVLRLQYACKRILDPDEEAAQKCLELFDKVSRRYPFDGEDVYKRQDYMWSVSWWSDPVMFGRYPEDGLKLFEKDLPDFKPEDLKLMHQPLDFYGQNIYNGYKVKSDHKLSLIHIFL